MKKLSMILALCLLLTCAAGIAAGAEWIPSTDGVSYPVDNMTLKAAETGPISPGTVTTAAVGQWLELSTRGLYDWLGTWSYSTDRSSWIAMKRDTNNNGVVQTQYLPVTSPTDTGTYPYPYSCFLSFLKTGTYYIRVYSTSTSVRDVEMYSYWTFKIVEPSLTVSPSSVSMLTGDSVTLTVSSSYINSYTVSSSNPKIASVAMEGGKVVVRAWKAGTATITLWGRGDYGNTGASCTVSTSGFNVKKPINYCTFTLPDVQAYTGAPLTPGLVLKDGSYVLKAGTDYTLSYRNNIEPGTATMTVTGIGDYTGSGDLDFVIKKSLSTASVSLIDADNYMYDGTAKTPAVVVSYAGTRLTRGTDYTVSYQNNTNVGTASAVITGKGYYTGSITKTFTIQKSSQTLTATDMEVMLTVPVSLQIGGALSPLTYSSGDTSIATVSSSGLVTGVSLGQTTITISAQETDNCCAAELTISVKVTTLHGSCGENVSWEWDYESAVLTISGSGSMVNYTSAANVPWYGKRASIKEVVIQPGICNIGSDAFEDCTQLKNITIPKSVTSIGFAAFSGCTGLTNITIPEGVTSIGSCAFSHCRGLTSVSIPGSVTSIGSSAFYGCSGLTTVTIPSSVTSIGGSAFSHCGSLTSITLPFVGASRMASGKSGLLGYIFDTYSYTGGTAVRQYYASSSDTTYYIPTSLKSVVLTDTAQIPYGAFYNCSSLTSITIPESVTSIDSAAFCGCSSLTSITIPESVTSIGSSAFSNCSKLTAVHITNLTEWLEISFGNQTANPLYYAHKLYLSGELLTNLTVPEGITGIASYAFYYCSSLTSVTIPESVKSIGDYAFQDCSGLTSISIPEGVTSIGDAAFNWCSSLKSVTIPESVVSIGRSAFACSGLTSISIPGSVTSIGSYAFNNCSSLRKFTAENGLTSIGDYAFRFCTGLTSVMIPNSVTSIDESAFKNCSSLQDVWYLGRQAQWNAIDIGSDNTCLTGASIHCLGGNTLQLPASLQIIESNALRGVAANIISVPAGVTEIRSRAFAGCSGLTCVRFEGNPASIADDILSGCTDVVILAPKTSTGVHAWAKAHGFTSLIF